MPPVVRTYMHVAVSPYGGITASYGVQTRGFGECGSKGVGKGKGAVRLEM
jgi:hypothetical protein